MSDELTYEQAREQLVGVVRELESGNVPLSKAMELWERGEELARVCQQWLDGARVRIDAARGEGVPDGRGGQRGPSEAAATGPDDV